MRKTKKTKKVSKVRENNKWTDAGVMSADVTTGVNKHRMKEEKNTSKKSFLVRLSRTAHSTDLVARRSPLQQQSEAIGCLLVVLQALTEPPIIILHQSPVHNHFQLT